MPEKKLADLFNIRSRFFRSAHLERDFDDPGALAGYVATGFVRSCLERLAEGTKPNSGHRAWRLTGDYGSGKSSFGLLVAQWLAGRDSAFPPQLRKVIDFGRGAAKPRHIPVLVTCTKQPLTASILKALQRTLASIYGRGSKAKPVQATQRLLDAEQEPPDDQILDLILEVNSQVIADGRGKGLLLMVDELGKFLEFAAQHPERQDVFLLQCLAEAAARSGDEALFVVCLLHQGFSAYAHDLTQAAQREWEKVSGRFEEIIFNHPVEQIAELIASALNVNAGQIPKPQAHAVRTAMEQIIALGWFGAAAKDELLEVAPRLYPLHPTVLPILVRAFRRFGQNERSLFSFLLSNEPFGLQAFAQRSLDGAEPYRLHDLYDYLRTSFGHRLATLSYRSHWSLIESVVESFATENEFHVKVLKTVGVLNLLNDDLVPTEEAILCALADGDPGLRKRIGSALDVLRRVKRVLYDRGRARGLCLWPHTCVDLEKAMEDARQAVDPSQRVAGLIKDYLETRPVVARRHYIKTGNLRYFDVRYCAVTELPDLLTSRGSRADGVIVIPLCETPTERLVALEFANRPELKDRRTWLVGVPEPLGHLASLVQEVQRWEWIATNTKELNADKYAREEVSRQIESARGQLARRVQSLIGFKQLAGKAQLTWFHRNQELTIPDGRHLLEQSSVILDKAYREAPRIHNELVNRHSLSSAAAAARMRLIERMFTDASAPFLGMTPDKKPPEMSMYLSVLKNTGLHHEQAGRWHLGEPPEDKCHVLPALQHITEIIKRQPDDRVNIAALFDELRKPPYGVRDGIIPLLLAVFAIQHEQDVAFYKNGTFLRELTGEAMLVLTKTPESFELQYCRIEGVRADLFSKLCVLLEVKPSGERRSELLDVVKPLCVFVAQLPQFALHTKKLSVTALAVRDSILNAREPVKLLFGELPKACGFEPFSNEPASGKSVQAFAKTLKAALDELRAAYPDLQERLRKELRAAFSLPGSFQEFRTALAGRTEQVVIGLTEPKLKAFCLRLLDSLSESEWLESIGSCLTLKPPAKWQDADEATFGSELADLAARFHRVESVLFAHGKHPKNSVGVRLAITQSNGVEQQRVIHYSADEEHRLRDLQSEFETVLKRDRRLGLAAASRAIWASLQKGGKAQGE